MAKHGIGTIGFWATTTLAIDFATKDWAKTTLMRYTEMKGLNGYLAGCFVENKGMAFNFMQSSAIGGINWVIPINIAAVLFIAVTLWQLVDANKANALPMGVLIGGAMSNCLDRCINGGVTDFIVFHYFNLFTFPIINVADIAITVAGLVLFYKAYQPQNAKVPTQQVPSGSIIWFHYDSATQVE